MTNTKNISKFGAKLYKYNKTLCEIVVNLCK